MRILTIEYLLPAACARMSRIFAILIVTASLILGQSGFDGHDRDLQPGPASSDMQSAFAYAAGGSHGHARSGSPTHICTQLICIQLLSVPERHVLFGEINGSRKLSPGDERGLYATVLQRDPPVPRTPI